ncbi:28 kDa heat- and acid-stable phosphoprotein isoform X1 [Kogia breviceps]|uniref:28 kDa heat- and acid-stable phosphoprotein isoform X1 n=1 Tax=Kogia breviceps TaxID=27615 RepID=UPI00042C4B27|nr:28 kDa heat- and acid-stable phosphoprotein isoform X3 [Kogia breviceps]|eukprot:XP_007108805.1 28 kDa heat- and acid-stable phosphoprotein isoform X3 [Physeter catodon]
MPKGGSPGTESPHRAPVPDPPASRVKRRKGGHKGRARQYTSPEEIDAQLQAEKQKAREEEEQGEEGGDGAAGDPKKEKKSLDSDESEDEEDDYQQKRKGVEGLIDIENPNRVAQTTKKVTQLDLDGPKELSRREREEIEKQKAKERYMKMHLAGKTEQAKADLARLAIIRKQREEAARKKEEERKAKDDAALSGKRMQSLSLNK